MTKKSNTPSTTPEIQQIPLDDLVQNPYNTRLREPDQDYITNLAESISSTGLIEIPLGRRNDNGQVELATGHNRLEAYRRLYGATAKERKQRGWRPSTEFETMPTRLRELTDKEMFEVNVSENEHRQDLNTIERSRAISVYIETFKATSSQAGKLFGISDGAARNYIRLLNLPKQIQDKIAAGTLSQITARKLLQAQAVDQAAAIKSAEVIVDNEVTSEVRIDSIIYEGLKKSERSIILHHSYQDGPPGTSQGGWLLNAWTVGEPANITGVEIKAEPAFNDLELPDQTNEIIEAARAGIAAGPIAEQFGIELELAEIITTWVWPPFCSDCRFYQIIDENHYCGLKPCALIKAEAWQEWVLEKTSKKMGIPIFKRGDGRFLAVGTSSIVGQEWQNLIDEKDPHLRLRIKPSPWMNHKFTDNKLIELGSVDPKYHQKLARQDQPAADHEAESESRREAVKEAEQELELKHQNQELVETYIGLIAGPKFGKELFKDLSTQTLLAIFRAAMQTWEYNDLLHDINTIGEKDGQKHLAGRLGTAIIYNQTWHNTFEETDKIRTKGMPALADRLIELAEQFGIWIPDEWHKEISEWTLDQAPEPEQDPEPETEGTDA